MCCRVLHDSSYSSCLCHYVTVSGGLSFVLCDEDNQVLSFISMASEFKVVVFFFRFLIISSFFLFLLDRKSVV